MRFLWSDSDFNLSERDITRLGDEIILQNDTLQNAFETHHMVLVDKFIIEEDELSHNTYICAKLNYSLQFGDDEDVRADLILLTRRERRIFGFEDLVISTL